MQGVFLFLLLSCFLLLFDVENGSGGVVFVLDVVLLVEILMLVIDVVDDVVDVVVVAYIVVGVVDLMLI